MQLRTTEQLVAKVRSRTDTETASPDTDFITDAQILAWLEEGYADMVDFILSQPGDSSYSLSSLTTTLAPGVTELPADFYRLVDVRKYDGARWVPLEPTKGRRTAHRACNQDWPRYELVTGDDSFELKFYPEDAAPGELQVTYVPYAPAMLLDASQSLLTFNSWDTYVVAYACIEVAAREKTDSREHYSLYNRSRDRIKEACSRLVLERSTTITRVETYPEDYFDSRFIL
jgi:hypothetical protein